MGGKPVWFSRGSRMSAVFRTADVRIPALSGFVVDAARELALKRPLSQAVRSAAATHPAAFDAFGPWDNDAAIERDFALKDELTFPAEVLPHSMTFERGARSLTLALDPLEASDVAALLSRCGAARLSEAEIHGKSEGLAVSLFAALLEAGVVAAAEPAPPLQLATAVRPGVTRLQHAGLLYRGNRAGILVDPHFHSWYEPDDVGPGFLRAQLEGLVDAIVISHGHHDHWHLPTLMSFSADTPIVVPRVQRPSLLSPDFAATLRALGFRQVHAMGWGDPPLRIGDLELHALPFFGEQPLLREAPRSPVLRNAGNTYVVRHESYLSWFLIDSGADFMGAMTEVAHEVRARFGRIDLLASNLRALSVGNPLYITGAGHYWLSLSADQMRRFASMTRDVLTLGPSGVAAVCGIVGARHVLPYAHWWGAIGSAGARESELLGQLESHLIEIGAPTRIVPWKIGDSYLPAAAAQRSGPVPA